MKSPSNDFEHLDSARGRPPASEGLDAAATIGGEPAADILPKIIYQRTSTDCAICTIAMALGRTYDEVMAKALIAEAYDLQKGCRAEYSIFEAFGLVQMQDFRVLHRSIISPEFFLHFSWGRRAILAVPSLNLEGGFHSVYWNGTELLDPSTKCVYQRWSELRPDEIILIAETGAHPKEARPR